MRLYAFRCTCPCEIVCFSLHNFLTRFPDEISCLLCGAFMSFACEIACLFDLFEIS